MILDGLTGTQSTAAGKAAGDAKALGGDLDRFLTLLVTQLQNQDPLNPMDSNEFTAQLVQFAGVEQQINQNANLETLIEVGKTSNVAAMVNLIGRRVEAVGATLPLVDTKGSATYSLAEPAAATTLTITDGNGNVVLARDGETGAGRHDFDWDGLDGSGRQLPDGPYTLEVSAQRADGSTVAVETAISGTVTGAASGDNGGILYIGAVAVPMAQVTAIAAAAAQQDRP